MASSSTRLEYDNCAYKQELRQSTDPMRYQLYSGKYVNCGNICRADKNFPANGIALVDVESELKGINRINSRCNESKHPYYDSEHIIRTNDPRLPPHITPYACERDIVPNNIPKMTHPGFGPMNPNVCDGSYPVNYYSKF